MEERLSALEHIVRLQSTTILTLKHENKELKASVRQLETDITHLTQIIEQASPKEYPALTKDVFTTVNNTDKNVDSKNWQNVRTDQLSDTSDRSTRNGLNSNIKKRLLGRTGEVAFHVYLTGNKCFNDHQVIDFDGKELDLGNGYNKNDGSYVVPVSGIYVFSWTFLVDYSEYAVTEIVMNGVTKGWTVTDGSSQSLLLNPATGFVILQVNAGDHVFIRRTRGRGCTAISNQTSRPTFSGWRLFH